MIADKEKGKYKSKIECQKDNMKVEAGYSLTKCYIILIEIRHVKLVSEVYIYKSC